MIFRVVWAFFRRDFWIERSYRMASVLRIFGVLFQLVLFFYISRLIGSGAWEQTGYPGGDYFSFLLVGLAFSQVFHAAVSSISETLRQEQVSGTWSALWMSPLRSWQIPLAASLAKRIGSLGQLALYFFIGIVFFGARFPNAQVGPALIAFLLSLLAFLAFGLLSASYTMVYKRGDPIHWAFSAVSDVLGGVYFPVALLPGPLVLAAQFLPTIHTMTALRLTLLEGQGFSAIVPQLQALSLFVLLLPVAFYLYLRSIQKIQQTGSLTHV